jgi:hypothetical protein
MQRLALFSLSFLSSTLLIAQTAQGDLDLSDPNAPPTFNKQALQGLSVLTRYSFGTQCNVSPNQTCITDGSSLGSYFKAYAGVWGPDARIDQPGQWQRFQDLGALPYYTFTPTTLDLTAIIPDGYTMENGGIGSGQIVTNQTFEPNTTGHAVYAFEVRAKVPSGQGMWPAIWFYEQVQTNNGDEIDGTEFFNMTNQDQHDWTGFDHFIVTNNLYDKRTNQYVWEPAPLDFSADYHDFQVLWTADAVYKFVDGTLIYANAINWTAGPAELLVSLQVGSDDTQDLPGLQPTSARCRSRIRRKSQAKNS